jgi:hypothetical protein
MIHSTTNGTMRSMKVWILGLLLAAMLMAALFDPLKRRIDAFVERRFFRRGDEDNDL